MAHMSYCMFENTYSDLYDCFEKLQNKTFGKLSKSEKRYAMLLVKLSKNISDNYLEELEEMESEKQDS